MSSPKSNYKTCRCGKPMDRKSKECMECRKKYGFQDEYAPFVKAEFHANLFSNVPLKTLARQLSVHHDKLKKLGWRVIWSRLKRIKVSHEFEMATAIVPLRDFTALNAPPMLSTGEAAWNLQERKSLDYLAEHEKSDERIIKRETNLPIGICFLGDQHIGNEGTNHKLMREDAEIIADTDGMYTIMGGDGWDNHIKHLAAIINAKSAPSDQIKMFLYYLSIFQNKIMAVISGNHEFWSKQVAGIDIVKILMERQAIVYNPHALKLTLIIGKQPYKVYIRHKTRYNSSFNPTHTIKQLYRLGDWPFDIGFRGDEHEADIEEFRAHGLMRWAIRGGSYQVMSEFAEFKGYPRTLPISPTIILYPDHRRIDAYSDLRKAILPLKAAREDYQKRGKRK